MIFICDFFGRVSERPNKIIIMEGKNNIQPGYRPRTHPGRYPNRNVARETFSHGRASSRAHLTGRSAQWKPRGPLTGRDDDHRPFLRLETGPRSPKQNWANLEFHPSSFLQCQRRHFLAPHHQFCSTTRRSVFDLGTTVAGFPPQKPFEFEIP